MVHIPQTAPHKAYGENDNNKPCWLGLNMY
jgi:hypothetical protein